MVAYDGTLRNSVNQVIQLRYGEDGMDATHIEFQNMPSLKPNTVAFERKFHFESGIERFVVRFARTLWEFKFSLHLALTYISVR